MSRRVPILARLLVAAVLPTALALAGFGWLAHYAARRALEDEIGRRLVAVASAAALAVRAERVDLLSPGDESSRAARNVRRKLVELRDASDVRRIHLVDAEGASRGDTDEGVPIGATYHVLEGDRAERRRALAGEGAASVLFTGRDGALYKRGWAPLRLPPDEGGAVVGAVAVEGSAELYAPLAGLRRTLWATIGAGLLVALALSVLVARRITRPLSALERAARTIGDGRLDEPVPVPAAGDEIAFLAATLEAMRVQLRARDERLQMMLAGIAHEVRNPLGGMELFAGLLREELEAMPDAQSAEGRAHLARIARELSHLQGIVTDFLDYARRARPEPRDDDAAVILAEVAQVLAGEIAASGLDARVRLVVDPAPPGGAPVRCDPGQLRRAVLNLGKNAVQAVAHAGGTVTLGCRVDGAALRIAVRDDGPGIADDTREKLFAPFYTTREKGTGLGLAFVAEIARDHGGTVEVDSAPGRGACFTIVLPAAWPVAALVG